MNLDRTILNLISKIILISLFFLSSSYSQNRTVSFNQISVKNGLSQNGVMVIFKDSRGYMWFGTRDGLNKYDGINFNIYRNDYLDPHSISNNFITAIEEDQEGKLWIGTNNGLNCYNPETNKFEVFKNEESNESSLSSNSILSILNDSDGSLWVGTENGLNLLVDHSNKMFKHFYHIEPNTNSLSDSHIHSLFEDSKNQLWIGTRYGGLNRKVKNTNAFIRFSHDPNNASSIAGNYVTTITEGPDKKIWIGTGESGISILNADEKFTHQSFIHNNSNSLSNNMIRKIEFDEYDNLWIATYDGLNYYNPKTDEFDVYKHSPINSNSISNNSIRSLLLDDNGFVWAGTYFGGINILNPITKQFKHFNSNVLNKKSLSHNVVGSLVEDNFGNVWIGTEGGGLNFFDFKNQSFSSMHEFYGNKLDFRTVKSLLIDQHDNLWIGTHLKGLFHLNFKTQKVKNFTYNNNSENGLSDLSITALLEDSLGRIWIGSETGLEILYPSTSKISKIQLKENKNPNANSVMTIVADSKNNIWIGTKEHGLFQYANGTLKHFQHDPNNPNSLSHNSIYDIFEDSKKQLWFGTYGGGLISMNQNNETFKKFDTSNGLINNIVYNIEEDNQKNLWLSTPGGLSKFSPDSLQFKNYKPDNGMPIDEFNSSSSLNHSSGNLFFGGFNGLIAFIPENIKDNPILPKIILSDLKLANKSVLPNDHTKILSKPLNKSEEIEFSHNQTIFSIEYSALNYSQIGQNQYAYKLEGLDPDWNYVGNQKSATYTNLEPGNYTFKVKAANSDGIWNNEIASLKIVKLPPFWKTYLAYLIYLIVTVILVYFIRKSFLTKLHLENNLKLEKLEKQQLEELTQLKLKFFTNISHDFRTPLSLIHGPLQELLRNSTSKENHSHLLLIKKNVNFMLRLINQLMDFRKMQTNKISLLLGNEPFIPFIKELIYSFKDLAIRHNIRYKIITNLTNTNLLFDKDKIEKITYNLLSNAFKFTPDGGSITIEISIKKTIKIEEIDYLEVSIKNTGHGINKEDLSNVFNRFFQNPSHIEHSQPGTGVGLSLVKSLIELHKGYIKVQSEPDKLTEFVFGIPLSDVYTAEEKANLDSNWSQEQSTAINAYETIENGTETNDLPSILIVEDNFDLRNFLNRILSVNYNIITAENGEDGLIKAQQHLPNIVISDIMMPKMSGIEMCKLLKNNPKTSHIPVILLTARTASSIELDSYGIGAIDFMSKPFDVEILKSKVYNLVNSMDSIKKHSHKEVLLEDSEININTAEEEFLAKLSNYVKENLHNSDLNVHNTGLALGMSRVHLYRKVKKITGQSPVQFIRNFRLSVAAKLLKQNTHNINEICFKVGFQDVNYFRKCFKKKYGICSTKYSERESEDVLN